MTLFLSGKRSSSDILPLPLIQQGLLIHHSLSMKKAPNGVSAPHQRRQAQSPFTHYPIPIEAIGTRSSEPSPQVDPCRNVEDLPHTLVENPDAQWQEDNVLSHPMKPFSWLVSWQQCSSYPRPIMKQQDGGPLHSQSPGFTLETTCLPLFLQLPDNEAAEDHGPS